MIKTYLLATTFITAFAGAAGAQAFNGEVGGNLSKDSLGNVAYWATLDVGAEAAVTDNITVFGNVEILGFDYAGINDVIVDKWHLGARTGKVSLSFGEQDDLFDLNDGLNEVGGNVLADPEADTHNLQVSYMSYDIMVGFNDVTAKNVNVTNVQVGAGHSYANGMNVYGVVDYNRSTEDFTLGASVDYTLKNKITLTGAASYNNTFAYQAGAVYKGVTGYVAGDKADTLAEAGVGYEWKIGTADAFAEVAYDFRTKEATPAVGVSFKF